MKEDVGSTKTVLTIAGFDPSSGAGITADLAVMAAHGLFGTSCITALTVQSTLGVQAWQAAGADSVAETLGCLSADLPPAGVKIGMLADGATAEAVACFLKTLPPEVPVVLDPVIRSSSGRELLRAEGVDVMRHRLLPRVDWVTPNLAELALLSGCGVAGPDEMERAAAKLAEAYPRLHIVATGGHLPEPDDLLLAPDGSIHWLRCTRIQTRATHGTGCAFSTALLCALVEGMTGLAAVRHAKNFVRKAMLAAVPRGGGAGPMELYWPLRQGAPRAPDVPNPVTVGHAVGQSR